MLLGSLFAKLAGAGLATKAAAGGAVVVVAASAAGAAGALPEPAQEALDGISAEGAVGAQDEGIEGSVGAHDEGSDERSRAFGERVSQDATGASDRTPGVDGCEIAREASGKALEDCGSDTDDVDTDDDESDAMDGFGEEVAADARGEDGTPGVDGLETSQEARERNRGVGAPGEDAATAGRPGDED